MDTILLARHGETVWNKDGIIIGNSDSPLTEKGKSDVLKLAASAAEYHIEKIISSPLARALKTSELYATIVKPTPEIIIMNQLTELSAGIYQGKKRKELLLKGKDLRESWKARPPEGESYTDAEKRVMELIEWLHSKMNANTILIVGHAGINRVFLKCYQNMNAEEAMKTRIWHSNILILKPGSREQIILKLIDSGQ